MPGPNGLIMPMVCGDEARLISLLPIANHPEINKGMPFKVIRLSVREDVTQHYQ
jgi:hypothetical protein